jgi:hypothetical protein
VATTPERLKDLERWRDEYVKNSDNRFIRIEGSMVTKQDLSMALQQVKGPDINEIEGAIIRALTSNQVPPVEKARLSVEKFRIVIGLIGVFVGGSAFSVIAQWIFGPK